MDVRPDGAGKIMIHKTSVDAALSEVKELQTDGAEATALLEAASKVLPALKSVDVEAIRTTVRPIPGDGLTCVGPIPQVSGYYAAITHSGVTLAPLLGRVAADEVVRARFAMNSVRSVPSASSRSRSDPTRRVADDQAGVGSPIRASTASIKRRVLWTRWSVKASAIVDATTPQGR